MKFSLLLLPNRAFIQRMSNVDPRTRRVYWALRIALSILLVILLSYFFAPVQSRAGGS
jgi:hypothetical protein